MPDDYEKLKDKYSKKLKEVEAGTEGIVQAGVELPSSLTNGLNLAKSQYEEANKNFSDGNKEEALKEMQEAVNSADAVWYDLQMFYLSVDFKEACRVCKSFEGHDDLAAKHIPNFGEHSKNFHKIASFIERYKSSDEKPPMGEVQRFTWQLQKFLKDFEKGEYALVAAIKKEKQANRFKWINIIAIVVAAILGGAIGSFLTYRLCNPAQPESSASEAENIRV